MPLNVFLSFLPPEEIDIVNLHIFESNNPLTGFVQIDSTPAGTYPNYITQFVTHNANAQEDWFAIQWENSAGIFSDLSAPIKGGTTTLIGELVRRVLLRAPEINETLVFQEAEAVVSYVYNVDDPYSIDFTTVNKLWQTELANLVFVSCKYITATEDGSGTQSWSAGMVSESSGDVGRTLDSLERLERRALKRLGIGGSRIASIDRRRHLFSITGEKCGIDSSRLLSARAIITEEFIVRDIETGNVISG